MTDLTELLGKVERAVGPDRELDLAIALWRHPELAEWPRSAQGGWHSPEWGLISAPEHYTSSLDAALALAERVLPTLLGWKLERTDTCWARLYFPERADSGIAATVPLALVAATLKALIAQEDEQGSARSLPCGAGSASHAGPQPQSKDSEQ